MLLGLQDCIEWFLGLACEQLQSTPSKVEQTNFAQWWDAADNGLKQAGKQQLPYKMQILKLNKARVNLKHHLLMPTMSDLQSHKAIADSFFSESTELVFAQKFEDVRMLMLVRNDDARSQLIQGYDHLARGKYLDAVCCAALAAAGGKRKTSFSIEDLDRRDSFRLIDGHALAEKLFGSTRDMWQTRGVSEAFNQINTFAELTSMGMDYFEYLQFLYLTPETLTTSGVESIGLRLRKAESEYGKSKEHAAFCLDFATRLLIRRQEFHSRIRRFIQ